jgi:type 1 glutamine amidotransferase
MLASILTENVAGIHAEVISSEQDLSALDSADAIVLGSDGGHLVKKLATRLDPLLEKGAGLMCIHYTLDPGDDRAVKQLMSWIGGSYEQHWSVNPYWEASFTSFPDHPVARGLTPFRIADEWYYHMRFVPDMKGVTPILSALPPESTRQGADGPHSGNPAVRARKGMSEVLAWVYERPGGGRGAGFTGMHSHWNWAQDDYRKMVLNAVVWVAKADVPEGGVPSRRPSLEELESYLKQTRPAEFDADAVRAEIEKMND